MKYLVIGAGGTGGCIGGYLADAGRDVTLIARGKHLEAIRRDGLVLHGTRRGELRVRVPACTAGEFTGRADVIFVCVKGYSVEEILPLVERASDERTVVIPILNVLGTGERMAARLPGRTVTDGCIYIVGYISSPGEITQSGEVFRIVYGEREGNARAVRLQEIAEELRGADIDAVVSDDIRRDAFRKFMLVSPMAATGAYFDLPMGGLQAPGEPREFFKSLVRELAAIADAKGYRYPVDMLADGLRRIDGMSPDTTASIQKDLKKGGASELDGLVFEPVRMARALGLSAPGYERAADRLGELSSRGGGWGDIDPRPPKRNLF